MTNIINHPALADCDEALSALELTIWRHGRDRLVSAIGKGLPLADCWDVYQRLMGAWQRRNDVMCLALADCERGAMINHLQTMEG